jgi:hypothetical protein
MNRAQIDRAEAVAEQLAARKHLTQTRRDEAQRALLDELDTLEEEKAGAYARRRVYIEQAHRFENYRQLTAAFLIAHGVTEPDAGWRASEHPFSKSELEAFTERQMAVGLDALTKST